jgi:hypothetical protein
VFVEENEAGLAEDERLAKMVIACLEGGQGKHGSQLCEPGVALQKEIGRAKTQNLTD